MMTTAVEIKIGAEARTQLACQDFLQQWEQLYATCPWATPLQAPAFVCTWFEHYRELYQPIIISQHQDGRQLSGLLLLAMAAHKEPLRAAGAHQAEYQVWLAGPEDRGRFVAVALRALKQALPGRDLLLAYLPKEAPMQWLPSCADLKRRVELQACRRPLMLVRHDELEASFKKKSNKSRFNRLENLGKLEFKRVTDPQSFAAIFDDLIACYDFRQGAVNDVFPFVDDVRKKGFHLALASRCPELLHVTVTLLNGRPIAALIGIVGTSLVHLAIIAYSPFLSKYSPGKLHLMLLGRELLAEGLAGLDLTPGDDAWKERFGTDHDQVYKLVVHRSAFARYRTLFWSRGKFLVKQCLGLAGVTPARLKTLAMRIRRFNLQRYRHKLQMFLFAKVELRVYRCTREAGRRLAAAGRMKTNCLTDLLKYRPVESRPGRRAFMADAMRRFERGESVYTFASDDQLLHFSWLAPSQENCFLLEVRQPFRLPEQSAVLYDAYTHPVARGQGLHQESLRQRLDALGEMPDIKYIYVVVQGDNLASRHVVEKFGFQYQCSLFNLRICGWEFKWHTQGYSGGHAGVDVAAPG